MTQFDNPYGNPYLDPMMQPRKTSALAITALICSLIFCCPITTVIGPILGLVAIVTIGSNPAKKGKGLAWAAVLIGLLFTVLWGVVIFWSHQAIQKPIDEGPCPAMEAAFAGDAKGFDSQFFGTAAKASDAEVLEFIKTLRTRYGEFRNVHLDEAKASKMMMDQMMSPLKVLPYVFQFSNKIVNGTVETTAVDPQSGAFLWGTKFGRIVIDDPDLGDIVFPPGSTASTIPGGRKPKPSSGGPATTATMPASAPADETETGDDG